MALDEWVTARSQRLTLTDRHIRVENSLSQEICMSLAYRLRLYKYGSVELGFPQFRQQNIESGRLDLRNWLEL
jgi:hypothetical protein